MSQREWIDKDFYKELGVSSNASADDIKKAYRKVAASSHPDTNPGDAKAEARFKAASEAKAVLTDPAKRKEYDETRAGGGGFGRGGFPPGGANYPGSSYSGSNYSGSNFGGGGAQGFDVGDLFGGLFNRGAGGGGGGGGAHRAGGASRPRKGADLSADITLDFRDAALGTSVPLSITSPSSCTTCHGSGASPGTSPRMCPVCNGAGVVNRNQGAFGFSEPCDECRGAGSIIDHPCTDCSGTGVQNRTRSVTVRVPAGVGDGQRVRVAGRGEAGLRGAAAGDLLVTVKVKADKVFGRNGDDLTLTLPVGYSELVLGATLSVPTLEGRVGLKVPAGTVDGRTFRVKGRGITKKTTSGDLLVTVKVAVPATLDDAAAEALTKYAEVEKASGFDPRAGWPGA